MGTVTRRLYLRCTRAKVYCGPHNDHLESATGGFMSNYFPPRCSLHENTHVSASRRARSAKEHPREFLKQSHVGVRLKQAAYECASFRGGGGVVLSLSPGISGVLGDTRHSPVTNEVARDTTRIKVTEKKSHSRNERTRVCCLKELRNSCANRNFDSTLILCVSLSNLKG